MYDWFKYLRFPLHFCRALSVWLIFANDNLSYDMIREMSMARTSSCDGSYNFGSICIACHRLKYSNRNSVKSSQFKVVIVIVECDDLFWWYWVPIELIWHVAATHNGIRVFQVNCHSHSTSYSCAFTATIAFSMTKIDLFSAIPIEWVIFLIIIQLFYLWNHFDPHENWCSFYC